MRRDRRRVPRRGRPRRRVVAQLEQLVLSDGTTIERPRAHVLEAQLAGSAQINPARVEKPSDRVRGVTCLLLRLAPHWRRGYVVVRMRR